MADEACSLVIPGHIKLAFGSLSPLEEVKEALSEGGVNYAEKANVEKKLECVKGAQQPARMGEADSGRSSPTWIHDNVAGMKSEQK